MKQYYIYLTTNLINGKKYIGKHFGELNDSYLGSGTLLKKAIDKYGENNFKKEILYISSSNEENNKKEIEFISAFNAVESDNFYNLASGGDGGDIFHSLPLEKQEQIKKNASQKNKGNGNGMYGKHHSQETKQKLKQIDKSYTQTESFKKTMSSVTTGNKNGMYGKKHTEEAKKKMSEKKKGKKLGSENGNAKKIRAYKDEAKTILVKEFDTIQEALIFVGTKPTDYSGISKRMKMNKPYKGFYWEKV